MKSHYIKWFQYLTLNPCWLFMSIISYKTDRILEVSTKEMKCRHKVTFTLDIEAYFFRDNDVLIFIFCFWITLGAESILHLLPCSIFIYPPYSKFVINEINFNRDCLSLILWQNTGVKVISCLWMFRTSSVVKNTSRCFIIYSKIDLVKLISVPCVFEYVSHYCNHLLWLFYIMPLCIYDFTNMYI